MASDKFGRSFGAEAERGVATLEDDDALAPAVLARLRGVGGIRKSAAAAAAAALEAVAEPRTRVLA